MKKVTGRIAESIRAMPDWRKALPEIKKIDNPLVLFCISEICIGSKREQAIRQLESIAMGEERSVKDDRQKV